MTPDQVLALLAVIADQRLHIQALQQQVAQLSERRPAASSAGS